MPQTSLVKATIRNVDSGETVRCMFNPTEYTFSKSVKWKPANDRGANVPKLEFTGGDPIALKMQLFFDTHESGEDVRTKYTDALWKLAMVDSSRKDSRTQQSSPPMCEFQWGSMWTFRAVVTSISQKFTLFKEDGTPTRATVDLSLQQAEDPDDFPFQNPTSGGAAGHRTHVVRQSDRLDLVAAQEYGEARHWRHIAEANSIDDPFTLHPGTVLSLPPLNHA